MKEYKVLWFSPRNPEELARQLNEKEEQGWEVFKLELSLQGFVLVVWVKYEEANEGIEEPVRPLKKSQGQ